MPLNDRILDRYIRVAGLCYHNIDNETMMKEIGMNLHLFGGIEMQRAIFYTFIHCFPAMKKVDEDGHHEDIMLEIRGYCKDFFDFFWDGVGGWKRRVG